MNTPPHNQQKIAQASCGACSPAVTPTTRAPKRGHQPERTQREADHGVVWHLDCGLLVTLPAFRRRLRALRGVGSYAAHVAHCHAEFDFESAKGTDEMMLEMFLLSAQPCGRDVGSGGTALLRLVRECASLRVHTLCAEAKKGRRAKSAWSDMPHDELPPYERQAPRALQYVYDDEVRARLDSLCLPHLPVAMHDRIRLHDASVRCGTRRTAARMRRRVVAAIPGLRGARSSADAEARSRLIDAG